MPTRMVAGLLGGLWCLLLPAGARAECTKDTDCKGDRVCENGACVSPNATPAAPAPAPTPGGTTAVSPTLTAVPPPPRDSLSPESRPETRRHSTGMMTGGIVMVAFVPVALLAAMIADIEQAACNSSDYPIGVSGSSYSRGDCGNYDATIYGGLISAGVLLGVGIPMIVIGGKKEPVAGATLTPWATPHAGGLGLRIDL